jgi:Spy/CpxP family protein refolding chaperone
MKNGKALLSLALIFVLGMVAGGLIVGVFAKRAADKAIEGGPDSVGKAIVARLSSDLSLDAAQKVKLREIVRDAQAEIREARRQIQPKVKSALSESEGRIRAILTPEQAKEFDRLVEKNRTKARMFEP